MKKLICLLMLPLLGNAVVAQSASETPYLVKSLANASITKVESETNGGNISVQAVSANEAKVEVYVWPSNYNDRTKISKEELEKRLENYDLRVSVSGGTVTATAKSKKRNMGWKEGLSISFKIYVPSTVSTRLRTSGGNIDLSNLKGDQDFSTSGGNLELSGLKGKVTGVTSGGNIRITNSDNNINLTTSGGNITANTCTGDIKLRTSGGNLDLRQLNGTIDATTSGGDVRGELVKGELEAHTSGGNVKMEELSCSLEASTSGGNISVSFKEIGSFVRLDNSGGNITLELPANKGLDLKLSGDKVSTGTLNNFSGKVEEDEVTGKLNGGGTPVTVRASSGRVNFRIK